MENIFQRRVRVFFVTTFVRIKGEGAFFVKVFETHTIMENLFFNLLWFWSSSSCCCFLGASSSRRPFVRVLYYMRSPDLSFSFLFFGDHTHTSVKTLYSMKTLNFTFFLQQNALSMCNNTTAHGPSDLVPTNTLEDDWVGLLACCWAGCWLVG